MPEPELPFPGDPVAEFPGFAAALRDMVDKPFLASAKWQEQEQRADRRGCHPDLLRFERAFRRRRATLGLPMFTHEAWRDPARQQISFEIEPHADDQPPEVEQPRMALFDSGKSQAKPGQGPHPYGCALDIVHSTKGWNLTKRQWDVVGHVGKEVAKAIGVRLVWGGDWKFYDPAHWEIAQWKNLKGEFPWPMK